MNYFVQSSPVNRQPVTVIETEIFEEALSVYKTEISKASLHEVTTQIGEPQFEVVLTAKSLKNQNLKRKS
jgi:hypothetical protein